MAHFNEWGLSAPYGVVNASNAEKYAKDPDIGAIRGAVFGSSFMQQYLPSYRLEWSSTVTKEG